MPVTAQSIIDRARVQLIDTDPVQRRWSDAELLYWISDAQRAIVAAFPQAAYKVATVALVAGTRQSLPADGYKLLDVVRNTTGTMAPCTAVDRAVLDRQNLTWHSSGTSQSVLHWSYDPRDPVSFFVTPRNDGSGAVEVVYSFSPPDVTAGTQLLGVRDIYATPVIDYVLYRAHSKDADFASGQQAAATYLQAFTAFMQAQAGGAQ